MRGFRKDDSFSARLETAAKAKKAVLDKHRAKPGADDPASVERRAARQALSLAREARLGERKASRAAEAARHFVGPLQPTHAAAPAPEREPALHNPALDAKR